MKVKVKVPFVFTDEDLNGNDDGMRIFDNMPQPMRAKVIDAMQRQREKLVEQVHFTEQVLDMLGRRG